MNQQVARRAKRIVTENQEHLLQKWERIHGEYWTHEQIQKSYAQLTDEDIRAVLQYAAHAIKQEKVFPLPA